MPTNFLDSISVQELADLLLECYFEMTSSYAFASLRSRGSKSLVNQAMACIYAKEPAVSILW